jgi:mRNA interferase RelE/StbE
MQGSLRWSKDAVKDLGKLPKAIGARIKNKVVWFSEQKNPFEYAEPLSSPYQGIYRYRVGDYRVLFEKDGQARIIILIILRIKHRREVYR